MADHYLDAGDRTEVVVSDTGIFGGPRARGRTRLSLAPPAAPVATVGRPAESLRARQLLHELLLAAPDEIRDRFAPALRPAKPAPAPAPRFLSGLVVPWGETSHPSKGGDGVVRRYRFRVGAFAASLREIAAGKHMARFLFAHSEHREVGSTLDDRGRFMRVSESPSGLFVHLNLGTARGKLVEHYLRRNPMTARNLSAGFKSVLFDDVWQPEDGGYILRTVEVAQLDEISIVAAGAFDTTFLY